MWVLEILLWDEIRAGSMMLGMHNICYSNLGVSYLYFLSQLSTAPLVLHKNKIILTLDVFRCYLSLLKYEAPKWQLENRMQVKYLCNLSYKTQNLSLEKSMNSMFVIFVSKLMVINNFNILFKCHDLRTMDPIFEASGRFWDKLYFCKVQRLADRQWDG